MSGYIGTQPVPQATQTRDSFTATSGQTSFATGGYTPNFLDVYLNGVKLASADYTASNGSDVVLASGAATGDILEVVAFTTFNSASSSIDDNGNATAITIDSSGNLLVGKTSDNITVVGAQIQADGALLGTRSGGQPMTLNRTSSDGDIAQFRKDGTTVGSIGSSGGDLIIGTGVTGVHFHDGVGSIIPWSVTASSYVNNSIGLGTASYNYKDLYLSGGVNIYNSSTDAVDIQGTGSRCEIDNPANNSILLKTGGTTRVRIDSNGLLFGSDTASANALDDYEVGTWTPTALQGASGLSHETANCCYTKIGRMVTLQFEIYNLTSPNGNPFNLGGIPFSSDQEGTGSVMYNNVDIPGSRTQIVVYASSSNFLRFYGLGDNTTWEALVGNNMGTSFNMIGQVTYMTA